MDRRARLDLIKEIIHNKKISTQRDLLEELHKSDVQVTQATVSRDIRMLELTKKRDKAGKSYYTTADQTKHEEQYAKICRAVNENVHGIDRVDWLNILHLPLNSGYADVLGALLDDLGSSVIVGTLAGNDTLVIISKDEQAAAEVYSFVTAHMNEQ